MDDGFSDRFKAVLNRVGLLQRAADLTDYSAEQIAKWRDGKSRPPFGPLAILCREAGVSMDWLAYGQGDPDMPADMLTAPAFSQDIVMVPFLSIEGSAGPGSAVDGVEVIDALPYSRALLRRYGVTPENAHALTARGDSMLPTILDGQVLLVDRSVRRVKEDAIYVVSFDDDIRIKRIQRGIAGSLVLKSDNPAYSPETLPPSDVERLRVEGRVFLAEQML
jgi:phage repressor protein C with HTH and peptisase S24 domain